MSLVLTLFSLSVSAATNLAWYARTWQTDEGLPDNIVSGVAQTADGYLWVATYSGLARFDGVRFREFAPASAVGVPSGTIYAMVIDRHGRLWLAKNNGVVVCVDGGKTQVFSPSDGSLILKRAREMVEDSEGDIWVSFDDQHLYRIHEGRMQAMFASADLPTNTPWWMASEKNGQLWFAKGNQVGIIRKGGFTTLLNLTNSPSRIAGSGSGGIWIMVGTELFKYREGGLLEKVTEVQQKLVAEFGPLLFEDHSGALWFGTRVAGLFRYENGRTEAVTSPHYEIWCLTEDREGSIWAGTRGGGLRRLRPRVVEVQDVIPGEAIEAVNSVCEDTDKNIWVAAGDNLLLRNQGAGWVTMSTNLEWATLGPLCVAADPRGGIWLGTRNAGVFRSGHGSRLNLRQSDGLASDYVRSLLVTDSGDVWIGTDSPGALQRFRGGKLRTFDLPAGSQRISAMAVDDAGVFWATTIGGHLLRAEGDSLVDETPKNLSVTREFRCLCATPDRSLWIGSAGMGLLRLKAGQITQYRVEQGLQENYIAQMVADSNGRLWFAGNRGIFSVKQGDFDEVNDGRLAKVRSMAFGKEQGLPALQPNKSYWPGALRSSDGRLWIPTLTGLAVVDPSQLKHRKGSPPVMIELVTVDGQIAAASEFQILVGKSNSLARFEFSTNEPQIELLPGHQQVEFEFTSLTLASPENLKFKYRLEGLDKNWVDCGARRTANYSHLPPGKYRFVVIACDSQGSWNETGAALSVTALPNYWETVWFRVGRVVFSAGLLAGLVAIVIRQRYRRRLERLEQRRGLERERARIAQDLHDDLGAGLVEISFGSELAQDTSLSQDESREHAREIGSRAREMVTALDEIVWAVNPKHDDVSSMATYFCQYAQNFLKPTPVRCHLDVAKALPAAPLNAEQRHNFFLAFKEALCNVVQHSGAKDLRLAISVQDDLLVVSVGDNGCGLDLTAPRERTGADGLGNMRRRLQQLNGRCELTSSPGQGMIVTFKVPLRGIVHQTNE